MEAPEPSPAPRPRLSPALAAPREKPRGSAWLAVGIVALAASIGGVAGYQLKKAPAASESPPPREISLPAASEQPAAAPVALAAPAPQSSLDFVRGSELAAPAQTAAPLQEAPQAQLQSAPQPLQPAAPAPQKQMLVRHLNPLPMMGGRSTEKTSAQLASGQPQAPAQPARDAQRQAAQAPAALLAQMLAQVQQARQQEAAHHDVDPKERMRITVSATVHVTESHVARPRMGELRPMVERQGAPETGDPSHGLDGVLTFSAPQESDPPGATRYLVSNASGGKLDRLDVFGSGGDHWILSLEPGQTIAIRAYHQDDRFWGR